MKCMLFWVNITRPWPKNTTHTIYSLQVSSYEEKSGEITPPSPLLPGELLMPLEDPPAEKARGKIFLNPPSFLQLPVFCLRGSSKPQQYPWGNNRGWCGKGKAEKVLLPQYILLFPSFSQRGHQFVPALKQKEGCQVPLSFAVTKEGGPGWSRSIYAPSMGLPHMLWQASSMTVGRISLPTSQQPNLTPSSPLQSKGRLVWPCLGFKVRGPSLASTKQNICSSKVFGNDNK